MSVSDWHGVNAENAIPVISEVCNANMSNKLNLNQATMLYYALEHLEKTLFSEQEERKSNIEPATKPNELTLVNYFETLRFIVNLKVHQKFGTTESALLYRCLEMALENSKK